MPPPGAGLTTVTMAVPLVTTSEAGTEAVSCDALAYVVFSAVPFHSTSEEATKSLPLTVSVKAGEPAAAVAGERDETAGTGLTAVIVNVTALDVPPPGLGVTTVTSTVPTVPNALDNTCAVSCVALT